jgi:hypothetical protein
MNDIVQDLAEVLSEIDEGIRNIMSSKELYPLLSRAVGEIERLRKANSEMGWRLNPDRSGGQFTDWEINRRGDEWS